MLPVVLSIAGGMLPMIVDAFRSGKSPEEAAQIIAPKRQEMVDRLVGSGMNKPAAETMADEAMADELSKAQLPEPMSPWLSMGLAAAGMFGGYKGGQMLKKGLDARKLASQPAAAPAPPVDAGPSAADVTLAQSGGMPLTRGKTVVPPKGTESPDIGEMMAPFPGKQAELPLTLSKPAAPPRRDNVDMAAMLAGGPFPG